MTSMRGSRCISLVRPSAWGQNADPIWLSSCVYSIALSPKVDSEGHSHSKVEVFQICPPTDGPSKAVVGGCGQAFALSSISGMMFLHQLVYNALCHSLYGPMSLRDLNI